jgi:hypothetical protein
MSSVATLFVFNHPRIQPLVRGLLNGSMELEKQICSLELAKKLKELGVKQDSLFWWVNGRGRMELHDKHTDSDSVSAFTVAELGEMLPVKIFASLLQK